jgi:hypothetical protein
LPITSKVALAINVFPTRLGALSVDQKAAVSFAVACTIATTNLQPKPDAEPKTAVSAKTFH